MAAYIDENGVRINIYTMARREGLVRITIDHPDPDRDAIDVDLTPVMAKSLATRIGRMAKLAATR